MLLCSIVDSSPAGHAGDRGSIPRRGESACLFIFLRPWAESRKGQLHWPEAALLHLPGIEPRPPLWQARILLMGQQRRMVEKRETPKGPRNEQDKLLVSIVDSIPACHAGDRG